MRRFLWLILMTACLLLPAAAIGASASFTVTRADAVSEGAVDRVNVYEASATERWLFLPSGWDASQLRIWFTCKTLSLNGMPVQKGDTVSVLQPGETVTVKYSAKGSYTLRIMQSARMNTIFLTTRSGSLARIHSKKTNSEAGQIIINSETGALICEQPLTQVRGHGNSTFKSYSKKSYQIKLEKGKNLFGMGKSKTWLLMANPRDRSQLRNKITSALANYAGLAYAPEMVHADLYVNGDYRGLYALTEKVEVSSSRLDIDDLSEATEELNSKALNRYTMVGEKTGEATDRKGGKYYLIPNDPSDITGGYLFEVERYWMPYTVTGTAYKSAHNQMIYFHTPKYASKAQFQYITSMIQAFENAVFSSDGIDHETGKHYSDLMDVKSLVLKMAL